MPDEPHGARRRPNLTHAAHHLARPVRPDRTGLLVTTGMLVLAALGVATIFADPILAAFSPPAAEPGTAATAPPTPHVHDGGHP